MLLRVLQQLVLGERQAVQALVGLGCGERLLQ
jgi:hypothetical protein